MTIYRWVCRQCGATKYQATRPDDCSCGHITPADFRRSYSVFYDTKQRKWMQTANARYDVIEE